MRHGRALSDLGLWLVITVLALLTLITFIALDAKAGGPLAEGGQPALATQQQVEDFIKHFLRGVKKDRRWKGAQELSGLIVQHAADPGTMPEKRWENGKKVTNFVELEPVDPLLVAVNFSSESSFWKTATGGVGELGLPQIHPKNLRALTRSDGTKYDMDKRSDQVEAGVRWLAYCIMECSNLEQSITKYKSGRCAPILGGATIRTKSYHKARKRIGLDSLI